MPKNAVELKEKRRQPILKNLAAGPQVALKIQAAKMPENG